MTPEFRRQLGWLERGWPWIGASAVATLALGGLAALTASGRLDGILAANAADHALRGYTPFGLFLGISAVLLVCFAAFYSLRKRPLQERLSAGRGSMTTWLWFHVAAGLVALAAALIHAGYGLLNVEMSTGKVLFAIFALLALSGVAWRVVYQIVPPIAAAKIGNYSELASTLRAEEQLTEIEKIAAGGSADLHARKTWVIQAARSPQELALAIAALPESDRTTFVEIHRLADSRRRALDKKELKASYSRWLQVWRAAHIPLTILLLPALVVHILGALDVPTRALEVGSAALPQALSGVHRSKDCRSCHWTIVEQWSGSMHAHALRSPMMIAQNNQVVAHELAALPSPDPRRFCVNCHSPVGVALAGGSRLPLTRKGYDAALLDEGIGCSSCHQYVGTPSPGFAGLTKFQDDLRPGSTYFGEIDDPVGNAFHRSATASVVKRDGALCASCHTVQYDLNRDGKFERGVDLILQTTTEEYEDYVAAGGKGTCVSCHMPAIAGATRVAEHASIGTEQDGDAPRREVHDHSFAGVDYPLDEVAVKDPERAARQALLRGAATLDVSKQSIKAGQLTFTVSITNSGAGHNLPSGFAFARQMWLEVRALGDGNRTLFESGVLKWSSDDLCDDGTFGEIDNPAKPFMVGCDHVDKQLVSFQQKLVDHLDVERDASQNPKVNTLGELTPIAAATAKESWIQHLSSGAVPRRRPSDNALLGAIVPGATRVFGFTMDVTGQTRVSLSVRLLFRSLPPYMVRALGAGQPPSETPKLAPLVANLQVVEMAAKVLPVDLTAP